MHFAFDSDFCPWISLFQRVFIASSLCIYRKMYWQKLLRRDFRLERSWNKWWHCNSNFKWLFKYLGSHIILENIHSNNISHFGSFDDILPLFEARSYQKYLNIYSYWQHKWPTTWRSAYRLLICKIIFLLWGFGPKWIWQEKTWRQIKFYWSWKQKEKKMVTMHAMIGRLIAS